MQPRLQRKQTPAQSSPFCCLRLHLCQTCKSWDIALTSTWQSFMWISPLSACSLVWSMLRRLIEAIWVLWLVVNVCYMRCGQGCSRIFWMLNSGEEGGHLLLPLAAASVTAAEKCLFRAAENLISIQARPLLTKVCASLCWLWIAVCTAWMQNRCWVGNLSSAEDTSLSAWCRLHVLILQILAFLIISTFIIRHDYWAIYDLCCHSRFEKLVSLPFLQLGCLHVSPYKCESL